MTRNSADPTRSGFRRAQANLRHCAPPVSGALPGVPIAALSEHGRWVPVSLNKVADDRPALQLAVVVVPSNWSSGGRLLSPPWAPRASSTAEPLDPPADRATTALAKLPPRQPARGAVNMAAVRSRRRRIWSRPKRPQRCGLEVHNVLLVGDRRYPALERAWGLAAVRRLALDIGSPARTRPGGHSAPLAEAHSSLHRRRRARPRRRSPTSVYAGVVVMCSALSSSFSTTTQACRLCGRRC